MNLKITMKSAVTTILFTTLFLNVKAQHIKHDTLNYITNYPEYVDGGCSFYTSLDIALAPGARHDKNKYKLIITPYRAFIQISFYKHQLFKRIKRTKTAKGYMDIYNGKSGSFTLSIDHIKKINTCESIRKGTLKITAANIKETIKVHGISDEIDAYNGYTKKQLHLKN